MFRYIALVWNEENYDQDYHTHCTSQLLASADQWRTVMSCPGLTVMCAGVRHGSLNAQILDRQIGVVLGKSFVRNKDICSDDTPGDANFCSRESQAILISQGRRLITHYWGSYVAILNDSASRTKWIIKDPTGNLPCYIAENHGIQIVFSSLSDCIKHGLMQFSINWAYVVSRVATGGLNAELTGLHNVSQVHRGQTITIRSEGSTLSISKCFYWNPLMFSQSDQRIDDSRIAMRAIRSTVLTSTRALAKSHNRIIHRLSGGLDSAVILGCFKEVERRPDITCLTYYTPTGRADERPWARLAAQFVSCDHIEQKRNAQISLKAMLDVGPSVEPVPLDLYMETGSIERRLSAELGATAIFSGDGGDSCFGAEAKGFAASEFLSQRGVHAELFRIAAAVAAAFDTSIWRVLASATRTVFFRRQLRVYEKTIGNARRLTSKHIREDPGKFHRLLHPWFNSCDSLPWPTVLRLGTLIGATEFYDVSSEATENDPEWILPLYAQPTIELCLRIPIYTLFFRGVDRGLARAAFKREVPRPILERQWKDRAPRFFEEILHLNRAFVRDFLLEGVLATNGILDRTMMQRVFNNMPSKDDVTVVEILDHLSVEAWARKWVAKSQASAA